MRIRLAILAIIVCLFFPRLTRADEIYTFAVDYSGVGVNGPGSTVNWQFKAPFVLTAATTITSFLSESVGPGIGSCGVSDVQIPLASPFSGYSSFVLTDFGSSCGGAGTLFIQPITSEGTFTAYAHNGNVVIGTLTIAPTPEPSAILLLATGILALPALLKFKTIHLPS